MANAVTVSPYEEGGGNATGGGARPPRLPRWTRQEILVLIQGKKVAESRGRGRAGGRAHHMGSAGAALVASGHPVEPKWATVSSYCRRHGVDRGPVQCRKRWSNLASDYKKIKDWECRRRPEGSGVGAESFWVMRNDLRRERKLPGFFDKEVYDILDGAAEGGMPPEEEEEVESWRRGLDPPPASQAVEGVEEEEEGATVAVFDSGRTAAEDGLFSDSEQDQDEGGEEDKEEERPPPAAAAPTLVTPISGMASEKQPVENLEKASSSREGSKRKQPSSGDAEEDNLQSRLVDVLERNSRMLITHLEAQNMNFQLDREQRKEHTDSLVGVLSKVADALARIADKL